MNYESSMNNAMLDWVGFDFYGISEENQKCAREIFNRFSELDESLNLGGRLAEDISYQIAVFAWTHPYKRGREGYEQRNERFAGDLDGLQRRYDVLVSSGAVPEISEEALRAHQLTAALKEEALNYYPEMCVPIAELPVPKELGELGVYDEIVHRGLEHMVHDHHGAPRWAALETMGRIGHEDLLPILIKAFWGQLREPVTEGSNFKPAVKALQEMATPESLGFLYENLSLVEERLTDQEMVEVRDSLTKAGLL